MARRSSRPAHPEARLAGQRAATAKTVRTVDVIGPDGQRLRITNLRAFCRNRSLSHQQMFELSKGRLKHHRGDITVHACAVEPSRPPRRVSTLRVIEPDGQLVTIVNLAAFGCVQHYRGYRLPAIDKPGGRA